VKGSLVKKRYFLIVVIILLGITHSLTADELVSYDPSWTLHELAASESIPVKQLAAKLGQNLKQVQGRGLSDLGISQQNASEAIALYREGEGRMVANIVITGMLIVFVSLVVVAFFISLFKHVHLFGGTRSGRKPRSVNTSGVSITSKGDMSERSIAALITAIFLHEEEVDSENRLLLTWKPTATNLWKIGGEMPNSSHNAIRRGRK
jgi:hypothetical protein